MLTGMELMTCPNLAVPAQVMRHLVDVESSYNPYAIGVVGGQLVRQPQTLDEALATVQMLESKGYNFSVGVAQVNRANLAKYGLDTYAKAFDPCLNLSAGSRILGECFMNAGGDWGKAFSCYYSGNFVTGFRDGYVQKIYDSIGRSMQTAGAAVSPAAIPLQRDGIVAASLHGTTNTAQGDGAAYRIAIRSVLLDSAATAATTPALVAALGPAPTTPAAPTQPGAASAPATPTPITGLPPSTNKNADSEVFVPQVHGPHDPPPMVTNPAGSANAQVATSSQPPLPAGPPRDPADLRQGGGDGAFVF